MTTCTTVLCAVCPAPRNVLPEVLFAITSKSDWYSTSVATVPYGKSESPILPVTDDLQHQLGLYHAVLNILVAPSRGSCENRYICSAKSPFSVFEVASNIAMVHMRYLYLHKWWSTYTWLQRRVKLPHNASDTFLQESDFMLIVLPGAIDKISKFCEASDRLRDRDLSPLCWGSLSPGSIPCCTSSIPEACLCSPAPCIGKNFYSEELPWWQTRNWRTEGQRAFWMPSVV